MKSCRNIFAVLVTAPDLKSGRKLAKAVLEKHLAACVNIIPKIESHYWWEGKLERGSEVLLLLKTTNPRLRALERCILSLHPYDTPEFLAFPLQHGAERYCQWLLESTAA